MPRRLTDADLAEILRRQGKPVDFKYRANPKRRDGPSESQMQQAVIRWWAVECKTCGFAEELLMAIPLQAARTPRNGARMKAEGARAGTPDLFLAIPTVTWCGLWIEMKTPTGVVSPAQMSMMTALLSKGYNTVVARSTDEAIDAICRHVVLYAHKT